MGRFDVPEPTQKENFKFYRFCCDFTTGQRRLSGILLYTIIILYKMHLHSQVTDILTLAYIH